MEDLSCLKYPDHVLRLYPPISVVHQTFALFHTNLYPKPQLRNMRNDLDSSMDSEQRPVAEKHLLNSTIKNITWRGVTVTVKDRETKQPKGIVDNVEGIVEAG